MKSRIILLALRYLVSIVLPRYAESNCVPAEFDKL